MRLLSLLDGLERNLSSICLGSLVVVLAAQVFFRYVLHLGLSWSEEVSRFLFIWFVYVSASYAVQRGSHIRVTAFVEALPDRLSKALRILSDIVWIGFNALVVLAGILLLRDMIDFPEYSTSLRVPLSFIHAIIPLAHALMIIRILQSYLGRRDGARGTWPAGMDDT